MSTLTKMLIVLQTVFSVALVVVTLMTIQGGNKLKADLNSERIGLYAAQARVAQLGDTIASLTAAKNQAADALKAAASASDANVTTLRTEKATLQESLDKASNLLQEAQNAVSRLSTTIRSQQDQLAARDTEIAAMRPEFTKLVAQNSEMVRRNGELDQQVALAGKAIRTLQEELQKVQHAADTGVKGSATEGIIQQVAGVPTVVQINGKVAQVQQANGRTYLTLALGTRDGVQVGTRFTIYRSGTYVGDAVVQRVVADESVAVMTLQAKGQVVQATDLAISGGGM